MALGRLCLLRYALIAAMLGLPLFVGAAPAAAQSLERQENERQENSVHPVVDNFIAYLRSETHEAVWVAAKFARGNQDLIDKAKSSIAAQIDAWGVALSGQKDHLTTLGDDASAMWETLGETAVSSWAKVEHHAVSALDWVLDWMRTQSRSDQRPEIPV
jgi:hypothetical protein